MAEEQPGADDTNKITGKMFLYEKPELLAPEIHGNLGFTPSERPFEFVRSARAVPLTMIEFGSAQRNFPIIFSNLEDPVPLAVLGLLDDENLFVEDDGKWDPMAYVPGYLQCHPFALASDGSGRMAVVVDTSAETVTENPVYPFFVEGKISEHADKQMRLITQYEQERERTRQFCAKLKELDMLVTLRAAHTPEGASEPEPIADYVGIDNKKLNELPADTVYELHKSGFLSAMYLQLYSLENWRHLAARKFARQKQAA